MDFFNIIYRCLFGEYYTSNERIDFFVFEFHKAKSKGLSFDLFKREVLNELESMRRKIRIPLDKYMLELTLRKNELEREKDFDAIEKIKEEIHSLPYKKGKGLDLYKHSNSEFKGVIYYADIDIIENHLNDAYNQIINEVQQTVKEPQPITKESQNLHTKIFVNNGFEVWRSMFDSFKITEKKRTDLRFMYEVMKYNNQINDTITVKDLTEWLREVYGFSIDKLHFTDIKSKSNIKRMSIYKLIQ